MPTFRNDVKLGTKVPLIKTDDLNDKSVTDKKLADGSITKDKIAIGAVTAEKLQRNAVTTETINDGAVTAEKIAEGAVSVDEIKDLSVEESKINNKAVTNVKIGDAAVDTRTIEDKSVTNAKIADESITQEKIFNSSVTTEKLADESVSAEKLQSGLRSTIVSTHDKAIELDKKKANVTDVDYALECLENKIGDRVVVEGNVTNLPDDEDLTSVSTIDGREVMRLNDRAYEPSNFSGKGYKILRKNIQRLNLPIVTILVSNIPSSSGDITITINGKTTTVALDVATDTTTAIIATKIGTALKDSLDDYDVSVSSNTIVLTRNNSQSALPSSIDVGNTTAGISVKDSITKSERKNVLTQDMINEPNTVYEIRYDFDLDGAEISIKDNCVLKFIGGTLNNGSIICNNTSFLGEELINAILKNVQIKGTIANQHFNFKQGSDITDILQNLLDVFRYVKIGTGGYKISKTIQINRYGTTIEGSGRDNTTISYNGEKIKSMFSIKKKTTESHYAISNSSIKNMTLTSNNLADSCIDNQGPSCTFENLHIYEFSKYGIRTDNSWCTHINNCIITYCKVGIFLDDNSHNTSIFECRIEHNSIYCILINSCAGVNIMNCVLEDSSKTKLYIYSSRCINILNNYFEGPNNVTEKEINVTYALEAFNEKTSINTAIFIGGIPGWDSEQAKYLTIDSSWPSYNINITNNHYEGASGYLVCASSCRGLRIINNNIQGKFPVFLLPYVYNVEIYDLEIYNNTSIIAGNNYKALPMDVLYPTNKYYLVNNYSVSHIFGSCKLDGGAKPYIENINDWNRGRSTDKAHYKISNFNENNLEILLNPDESGQYVYSITSNNIIPEVGLYCIDFTFLPVTVIGENSKLVIEILILDNNRANVATKTINYKLLENEVINSRIYVYIDKINFSGFFIRMSGLKSQEIVKFINPKIYKVGSEIPNIKYFLQPSASLKDITTSDLYTTGIIPGTVAKYKDTYKVCIKKAENNIDFDIWTDIKNGQNANLQESNTATWFSAISSNNESVKVPVPKQWSQLSLKSSGNYNEKPLNPEIGFAYFCTDKQTTEGSASGIMIYYKGNNIWVDALGRVVDNSDPTLAQDTTT